MGEPRNGGEVSRCDPSTGPPARSWSVSRLLPAACGGDDSSASSDGNLIDRNVESAVKSGASSSTAAPEKEPTTMPEWEALWKTQREAIVARIKENHWGLQPDGKTVLGRMASRST